ncbi:Myc-type, basic helix-loop-helix domain-containing protein [Tanacetum coccineum]
MKLSAKSNFSAWVHACRIRPSLVSFSTSTSFPLFLFATDFLRPRLGFDVGVGSGSSSSSSVSSTRWNGVNNNNINSRNLDTSINSMVEDMGFPYSGIGFPIDNLVTQELQRLARIKEEFSVAESYPKFLELLNGSPTTSSIEDLRPQPYSAAYMKTDHHDQQISYSNNNQDFLLTNFLNGCQIKGGQLVNDQNSSNGTLSQIFPTISISSLNQSTTSSSSSSSSAISSSSFDMNCLPALDHFGSPRFDASFSRPSSLNANNLGGFSYGLDRMNQPNHKPSVCPSKISSVSTTGSCTYQSAKRPASNYIDEKVTQPVAQKKSKSEPRAPCAPFQVRKEKLGDRIAAIQQMVAPFGKTDTASVLMEAIGYIKFLHTQVETLSVPYMKSTNKIYGISSQGGRMEDGVTQAKRDLQSRGLCLVPLSCLSYVTDGCEGIWPTR